MKEMIRWEYDGAILVFDKCVEHNWKAETWAVSEAKAANNFRHQYRKAANLAVSAKVTLAAKPKKKNKN